MNRITTRTYTCSFCRRPSRSRSYWSWALVWRQVLPVSRRELQLLSLLLAAGRRGHWRVTRLTRELEYRLLRGLLLRTTWKKGSRRTLWGRRHHCIIRAWSGKVFPRRVRASVNIPTSWGSRLARCAKRTLGLLENPQRLVIWVPRLDTK